MKMLIGGLFCFAAIGMAQIAPRVVAPSQINTVTGTGQTLVTSMGNNTPGHGVVIDGNGNYVDSGSVGTSPGSPANSIQFNNAGAFGGDASLTLDLATGFSYSPIQPSSIGTTPGTQPPSFVVVGALGGDTTIATTGVGGAGTDIYFAPGIGGVASAAVTNSTGGIGGQFTIDMSSGGDASAGATSTGGQSGAFILNGGSGGSATGTGTNVGGAGSDTIITANSGGNASGGTSNTGGVAGNIVFNLATGGTGSTLNGANGGLSVRGAAEVFNISYAGKITAADLKITGAATGKKVVCVDITTGILYASSTGVDCSN